jgi:metal-responsive CopG/Arc/MetJ family transcriptional regulator
MRITVELDPEDLDAVSRLTGIEKKSPAVAQAIHEYLRQKEREAFLKSVLAGETDYSLSNEEVEGLTKWDEPSRDGS